MWINSKEKTKSLIYNKIVYEIWKTKTNVSHCIEVLIMWQCSTNKLIINKSYSYRLESKSLHIQRIKCKDVLNGLKNAWRCDMPIFQTVSTRCRIFNIHLGWCIFRILYIYFIKVCPKNNTSKINLKIRNSFDRLLDKLYFTHQSIYMNYMYLN